MAKDTCPICGDALGDTALTVTVAGAAARVCCEDCAREARARPEKLQAARTR